MTAIPEMTSEKLRIRCAEKCGWKYTLDNCGLIIYSADGFIARHISMFCLHIEKIENLSQKGLEKILLDTYPDYEHDRNALMELILAVPEEKHIHFIKAMIENLNLDVVIFNYTLEIISLHKTVPGEIVKLLTADPLAIMRAFLMVMEEEEWT